MASTRDRTWSFNWIKSRTFLYEGVLSLFQRNVLTLKLPADDQQLVQPFFEPHKLQLEVVIAGLGIHRITIEPGSHRGQQRAAQW